ncbi:MFS transporter [Roseateles sp. BYS78W]|uniref:MFS transporter n=1 Tax=Pelomonas candidula TaxID=3299025 RepID=A0ABW7HBM6_9BURK
MTLVYMLTALNGSAVSTALPKMAADLRGFELYSWPASAYLLSSIVVIPIVGRLGDLHGRKRILLWAVATFAAMSASCAAARTMEQLVVARALQGIGGGMIVGVLSACIADLFPEPVDRMRWQLMHSVGFAVAQGLGPWLGGWLTEHASWRWVFMVTAPVSVLAWCATWLYFPAVVHHKGTERRVDVPSIVLLTVSLTSLVLWSGVIEDVGLASPAALACLGFVATTALLFAHRQKRCEAPIVPLEVMSSRGALQLLVLGALAGLVLNVLVFTTPLLLQAGLQLSADDAGGVMTPLLLCITLASVANARIAMRMDRAEGLMVGGHLLLAVGCALLAIGGAGQTSAYIALSLGICGAAFGFLLPNFTQHILVLTSRRNGGLASALGQASRLLGGLLGAALGWALVAYLFRHSTADLLAASSAGHDVLADLISSPQVLVQPDELLKLKQAAVRCGVDPDELVALLKTAVTDAIRVSYAVCGVLALGCAAISSQLPPFYVNRR